MTQPSRPQWSVAVPTGGWGRPWPQVVELVRAIPGDRWTLIDGLMVQLHIANAGLPIGRATVDVDMVLHVETGAITFPAAKQALESLGYEMQIPGERGHVSLAIMSQDPSPSQLRRLGGK